MLGLRLQIRCQPVDRRRPIADDDDLRWPGGHVDGDVADYLQLGRGDVRVARSEDLGNPAKAFGAVSEGSDGLRTADRVDLGDAAERRRRQHSVSDMSVRRWRLTYDE